MDWNTWFHEVYLNVLFLFLGPYNSPERSLKLLPKVHLILNDKIPDMHSHILYL